ARAPRVAACLGALFPRLTWIEDDYDDGRYEESQVGWVVADSIMRARARAQRASVWAAERSAVKAKHQAAAAAAAATPTSAPRPAPPHHAWALTRGVPMASYLEALGEQCIIG
ncbi:hypothetical protein HDZ31DRAFT_70873, partial [Schizophyllum fasciatum]